MKISMEKSASHIEPEIIVRYREMDEPLRRVVAAIRLAGGMLIGRHESVSLVQKHQDKLKLTKKQFERWAGKRYIVLIQVGNIKAIEPFGIDKSNYGNMDDWLPVENINNVRL